MSQPLVSIIVPCYNMSAFLEETLASVCASDYPHFEVLVIDDGSTDDSLAKAEAFASRDSRVRVIHRENGGLSAARNTGLQHAKGKYILPVDADDRISSIFISHAVDAMEHNSALKVVYCQAEFFGERNGRWKLEKYSPRLLARKNIIPATALYRREEALQIGGYCEERVFHEDWDFWLSMLSSGGEVLQLNEVGFFYRIRRGSMRHITSQQKREMVDIINRRHADFLFKQLGGPLHYHRSWSRFLNLFRKEKVVTNDDNFQFSFFHSPFEKVLHSGRNIIYEQDGLVIKQFAKPGPLKALIYGWFVKSKARRSYEYAERLIENEVYTPDPVAYREVRVCGFLRDSYYVCLKAVGTHTFNELIGHPEFPDRNEILSSIGWYTACMHEIGALHQDYSGGNIMFDEDGFVEVIDLNRIRWRKHIGFEEGCKNFERLNIDREALTIMAESYAKVRHYDPQQCAEYIISHRWNKHVRQGITNL